MATRMRDTKGRFVSSHGGRRTPLYNIWCAMKERCNNPHNKRYSRYGGRGIVVSEEWMNDFSSFREWAVHNGYAEGLTIDRIDNDKGYSPCNCRWVTRKVQNRNYSKNHNITYNGKTMCIADWAEETGINRATILFRLKANKSLEEVFDTRDRRRKNEACVQRVKGRRD